MKLYLEWSKPLRLKDASADKLIFKADSEELPAAAGIYVFGRRWGQQFEALYVGKAANIRSRVKRHFNNLRLMNHIKNAKNGQRIVYAATLVTRPRQKVDRCLDILERGFIRHFLSEGHDLANKQGTVIRRHELMSAGNFPKNVSSLLYVEKGRESGRD